MQIIYWIAFVSELFRLIISKTGKEKRNGCNNSNKRKTIQVSGSSIFCGAETKKEK